MRLAFSEGETARLSGQKSIISTYGKSVAFARQQARLVRSRARQFAKRNEPVCCFIPEHQAHAGETLHQSKSADIGEIGVLAKSKRQPVKWNPAAQVVNMVHADIGGEPAQHHRQIIM